jgi:hypothetical protein
VEVRDGDLTTEGESMTKTPKMLDALLTQSEDMRGALSLRVTDLHLKLRRDIESVNAEFYTLQREVLKANITCDFLKSKLRGLMNEDEYNAMVKEFDELLDAVPHRHGGRKLS